MRSEYKVTRSDLERRLAQGQQTARIAAETGYPVYQLRAAYKRHGLTPRYQGYSSRCSRAEFIELVTGTRLTLTQIANKIGVTSPTVSVQPRRLGLKTSLRERGVASCTAQKITDQRLREALDAGMRNVRIGQAYRMLWGAIANSKQALREQSQGAL